MRRVCTFVVAIAVLALVASPAMAQGQRPGGAGFGMGPLQLLGQESVQKEINATPDQVAKVKEFNQKNQDARRGLRQLSQEEQRAKRAEFAKADEKFLSETLKPEQLKRVKQIAWQRAGAGSAFNDPDVAKELGLTAEQKEKVQAIRQDSAAAMRELLPQGQPPNEETRKKMEEFRKSTNEKYMNVLTADQKTKYKDLLGAEFKGEIRFTRPGGGGR